jgi:mono/diheme cytochrome c family protein
MPNPHSRSRQLRPRPHLGWRLPISAAAACAAALLAAAAAAAQNSTAPAAATPVFSPGLRFIETDGAALYANVCQACHMEDGLGAAGAGRYPALAGNANLAEGGYPVIVVVRGLKSMPPVGRLMSDEQVAAVVNYVRVHFGNAYADGVTAADVAAARR